MVNGNRIGTTDVDDASNPPIGIALLTAALAVAGLYLCIILLSVSGSFATSIARGAVLETGFTGAVFLGLALTIAGFYAALYGLWTGTRWGWYGGILILLGPLGFEGVRVLGYALGIGPITFLFQPQVNLPLVAGSLLAIGYLCLQRKRYLERSDRFGFRI